ncbi:MAG: endonuclease/exonuclease/phosphatase family protein, partial [Bacteroidales bacterium]|nr:endonuclease/exonuclease/phosphatase family protein [Bacteroidales bacterium]
ISLIVLLGSAFSNRISPLSSTYIPYLGLFFPFVLAFNILLLFFWVIFRKWLQALTFILVIIVCWGSIRTYFPINPKTKEIPENCIKILTYNVMRFEHLKKHTKDSPNPIIQYVIDQDPDIVCFQEFGMSLSNKKLLMENDIAKALHKMPYYHIEKLDFPHETQMFGLAVFSKFPILSVKPLPIESKYNGSCVFELNIHGKKLTLINNHLESNKISADERSDYYNLTKELDTHKLEAFTHMMFQRLTPAYKLRAIQADMISEVIQNTKNNYTIVCGDFNDTPISYARYKIKGNLKDAFTESGSGMGITFNRHRFFFRIDYILHSDNIKAYNCTVGNLKNSDHYPVWTYLEFLE